MPEDDDLNFALLALTLVEHHGDALTTDDVARAWLEPLPAGRVFTAERIAYRNLLDGHEPDVAGRDRQPVPGLDRCADPHRRVRLGLPGRSGAGPPAWRGRTAASATRRNGLYGAMFVAAASSAATVATTVDECIAAGLSVVPAGEPLRRGDPARRRARPQRARHRGGDRRAVRRASATSTGCTRSTTPPSWRSPSPAAAATSRRRSRPSCRVAGTPTRRRPPPARSAAPSPARRRCHRRGSTRCQPSGDEHRRLRRHRLRRAGATHRGRTVDVIGVIRRLRSRSSRGRSTGRPCCRSTVSTTRRSPTGPRSSPPPTTPPTGRPGASNSAAGATTPAGGTRDVAYRVGDTAGRAVASPRRSCGCGTSGCSTTTRSAFTPDRCSPTPSAFGGFDAIVLWHAYPIIGLDERNQFDFYRDVPGLAELVADAPASAACACSSTTTRGTSAHAANRRRRRDALAALVTVLGADGVFLDTMREGGRDLVGHAAAAAPASRCSKASRAFRSIASPTTR